MNVPRKRVGALAVGAAAALAATLVLYPSSGQAGPKDATDWTSIPANPDTRGIAVPNALSPSCTKSRSRKAPSPSRTPTASWATTATTPTARFFPTRRRSRRRATTWRPTRPNLTRTPTCACTACTAPTPTTTTAPTSSTPGHETGVQGYLTRINLDADSAHRVTLIADRLSDGSSVPTIDGLTWDPWAHRLLFTTESPHNGAVIQSRCGHQRRR